MARDATKLALPGIGCQVESAGLTVLPRASHLQQGGVYPRCSGVGLGGQELKTTGWLLSVSGQRLIGWSTNRAVEVRQLAPWRGWSVRRVGPLLRERHVWLYRCSLTCLLKALATALR